jgi:hypothetical protein
MDYNCVGKDICIGDIFVKDNILCKWLPPYVTTKDEWRERENNN